MKILAIDSSSIVASVTVLEESTLLGERVLNNKMTHSQTLMPMIAGLLKDLDLEIQDIDVIAVAEGPGSFTGLRIGVATAKSLAYAANKPLVAVPTLEGLASLLPFAESIVCPIMDAKRNQVYSAMYTFEGDTLHEIWETKGRNISEVIEKVQQLGQKVIFVGDGLPVYRERLVEQLGELAQFAPVSINMQKASALGWAAMAKATRNEFVDVYSFSPQYHRLSQAEREYAEKMKG